MMAKLIVEVTPECEGLLHSLPRFSGWDLENEEYREDDSGTITISFDGDDITAATEQALNTNDGVISYHVEPD